MDPKSPNVVEGGKRPFHTIVPAFLTQQVEGRQEAVMSFDVMGGDMQPQGHLRSVVRMLDYCQQPQAACDAPRLCSSCSRDLYRASRWAAKPAVRLHGWSSTDRRGAAITRAGGSGKGNDPGVSFSNQWVNLILAIGIVAQSTVGVHVLQLYMPMYAVKQLPMPAASSFGVVVLNGGLQFLLSPVIGVTIFGGLAPTIVETFIRLTGNKLAPSYCVLIAAVLSGVSLAIVAMRMRRPRSV